jgi:4-hydroxy-4-methyl-2-oxoglutarate aldolase
MDVIDALDAAQKPTILVMQQKWPPELHRKAGLAGEIMVSSMMAVQAINVPVSVGGMDVAPGELIHMDENGAVKFPPQHAKAVLDNANAMHAEEATRLVRIRSATTAAAVRSANAGTPYTPKKD